MGNDTWTSRTGFMHESSVKGLAESSRVSAGLSPLDGRHGSGAAASAAGGSGAPIRPLSLGEGVLAESAREHEDGGGGCPGGNDQEHGNGHPGAGGDPENLVCARGGRRRQVEGAGEKRARPRNPHGSTIDQ